MPKTKIFCDIADSKTIKEFNKKSIVNGFTTNPSLMRKAGAKSYEKYSKQLLKICKKKPISLEVFADNFKEMEKQAFKINSWGKNIYVKIPVINSKGKFTGQLIRKLNKVKNSMSPLSLIFQPKQSMLLVQELILAHPDVHHAALSKQMEAAPETQVTQQARREA